MQTENRLLDDLWRVRIYNAEDAAYDSIELQNVHYPYWVVSYIIEGDVEVTDGGRVQNARSGQVMLHAPGIPFGEKASTPGRHLWMLIEVTNSFQVDLFRLYSISEVVTLLNADAYRTLFLQLFTVWRQEESQFRELELAGIGLQLVYRLLVSWDKSGRSSRNYYTKKNDERLDAVISFLNVSLNQKISRQTLADLVYLNASYLDKIFSEKFHINPMQMLRELRLKKARWMLEKSDASLAEIAVECGLGDAPYLSRQFHKRYGLNPGEYREQVRQVNQTYYPR